MKNEGFIERGIQASVSAVLLLIAYFWLAGVWAWAVGVFSLLVGTLAIIGFCPLYVLFKIKKEQSTENVFRKKMAIVFLYLSLLVAGSYASNFFSKKIFIEDFNLMNNDYKQTLFNTGQEKRAESITDYEKLLKSYAVFEDKYLAYQPYALRSDKTFESDLRKIEKIITEASDGVYVGDLKNTHLEFEKVRPITQEMFKRNGFSMLAITLVDFHDSMEKVLDKANVKDAAGVIFTYVEANDKLLEVEMIANDEEIKNIRKNLEDILQLAKNGSLDELPAKSAELKSSFVKVYLKRG